MHILPLLLLALSSQFSPTEELAVRRVPECRQTRCSGKRIKDNLGVLLFCVPRSMRVTRETGEHGDVHYTISLSRRRDFHLLITSGPYFPGRGPDWETNRSVQPWRALGVEGKDFRSQVDGLQSRYMTLNAPMGYAQYKDVPHDVAVAFDSVLDSMCIEPLPAPGAKSR